MEKEELNQIVNAIKDGIQSAYANGSIINNQDTLNRAFTSDLASLKSTQDSMAKQIDSVKELLTVQMKTVDDKVTDIKKSLNRKISDRIAIGIPIAAALILAVTSILVHFV